MADENDKLDTTFSMVNTATHKDGTLHSRVTMTSENPNVRIDALVGLQRSLRQSVDDHLGRSLDIAEKHAEMKLGAKAITKAKR